MNPELFPQSGSSTQIVEGLDVNPYLSDRFGFDSDIFLRAIEAGRAEAAMTTNHSPAPAFGWRFWEASIRQLRDDLALRGWRAERPGQLEVARNKSNSLQIATALGDTNVGKRLASPCHEHPRGASTVRAVDVNQLTLSSQTVGDGWDPIETWWLLYHHIPESNGSTTSEISLPTKMSGTRITEWAVRVFLPSSRDISSATGPARLPEGSKPISFPVERRAL